MLNIALNTAVKSYKGNYETDKMCMRVIYENFKFAFNTAVKTEIGNDKSVKMCVRVIYKSFKFVYEQLYTVDWPHVVGIGPYGHTITTVIVYDRPLNFPYHIAGKFTGLIDTNELVTIYHFKYLLKNSCFIVVLFF